MFLIHVLLAIWIFSLVYYLSMSLSMCDLPNSLLYSKFKSYNPLIEMS